MYIISGSLKGRNIKITTKQSENKSLRPTTDYAKQVLFNLLNNNAIVNTEIEGKKVLDAFAGTGAVGFEFFSRGAGHITFIESDLINAKQLKIQSTELGVSSIVVSKFLPADTIKEKFDIIFTDPSYEEGKGKVAQVIKNFLESNLEEGGIIILETLNQKSSIEELKKHLEKKNILQNLVYEREASKAYFMFFK